MVFLAKKAKGRKSKLDNELQDVVGSPAEESPFFDEGDKQTFINGEDIAGLSDESKAKIKAEIASPFRAVRKFAYIAMGLAGGLGTFTAVPQLIFALQDGGDAVPSALGNIAIDLGGVIGGVLLYDRENKAEEEKLDRFTDKERKSSTALTTGQLQAQERAISLLPVEIVFSESNENVTRIVKFADLQAKGNQNVVIAAGPKGMVRDTVISARLEGNDYFIDNNIYVVPVVMDGEQLEGEEDMKGFGNQESLLSGPYIGKPAQLNVWKAYLQTEFDSALEQGAQGATDQGLVLIVNSKGKVVRRGLGLPAWGMILEDLLGKKDKK